MKLRLPPRPPGKKVRVYPSDVIRRIVESAALTHVTLPITNIYPAIQQGAVVGQENPTDLIYAQNLHATAVFVALTQHVYGPIPMVMSEASWKRLSATD